MMIASIAVNIRINNMFTNKPFEDVIPSFKVKIKKIKSHITSVKKKNL